MKKLFTNDRFFLAMVLFAVIGEGLYSLLTLIGKPYLIVSLISIIFSAVCVAALYSTYRKHSKNVTKALMGALLMSQLNIGISLLNSAISVGNTVAIILDTVFSLAATVLFINHMLINSDHHSSPAMISMNQVLAIIIAVVNTVSSAYWLLSVRDALTITASIFDIIGFIGTALVVVCVESRLDAYRLDREAAGWTEEKGYPEGYVHEYEKKDN